MNGPQNAEGDHVEEDFKLPKSEYRLSDIISFLPDATFAIDKNGVVIAWNHAIEEMTGVPADQMIGKGDHEYSLPFYGERRPMLIDLAFTDDPELRSRYALVKEMPGVIEAETRYAKPRGEDRILWARVSPLINRKGEYSGAIETIRDITGRKQREEALERSERLQKLILAAVPDILIRCNAEGRYLDILTPDDDRLVVPKDEVIGKTVTEVTSEEIGGRVIAAIGLALETGKMQTIEYTLAVPAGTLHFEARIAPYADDEVIALIRDITAQKDAEDALHERIKELSCLYRISAAIEHFQLEETEVFRKLVEIIPEGFKHPEATRVRITIDDATYSTPGFTETPWSLVREISVHQQAAGSITICFDDEYSLLTEESVLSRIVAEQIGRYIERIRGVEILKEKNEELAGAEEELRSQLDELVATQQQLEESEEYIRTVLDNLPIGVAVNSVDPEVNFEYFNENFFRFYRTTAEALKSPDAFWDVVYEDPQFRRELRERVLTDIASGDPDRMVWEDIPITREGEKTAYISARNIPVPGKDLAISTVWDVTGRVEAEQQVSLHLSRTKALLDLHRMTGATEQELMDYALDASLRMTESRYAFVGLMNEDESEMTIHAWSRGAMEGCTVQDKPIHFPIESAGVWGECVRLQTPTIINDYTDPHPAKHGLPEGHVPITRYLGVPIFHGTRIVAVLAVANKEEEYQDDDVSALATLGNLMGDLIFRQRAEAALQESEEKYRLLVENQQDLVVKTDSEGNILYANPAYCRLFDKTEAEILGTHYMPLVHPDDQEVVAAAVSRLFEPPYETSYEERAETRFGWRWIAWTAKAWQDDQGQIISLVGTGRDITGQKEAEESLVLKNAAIESSINGVAIADLSGILTYVNPAFLAIWGYDTPDEVIGRHVVSFWRSEEAAAQVVDMIQRHGYYSGEMEGLLEDGTSVPIQLQASIVHDASGTPVAMMGSFIDITDRKRSEDALKKSEERYRFITNVITDFAYSCLKEDGGMYQIDWMAGATRQITGYEIDEVIAEGCWGFMIHPDDWKIFEDAILSLPVGESSECNLRIITKDGNVRWLSAETRCIRDETGKSRVYGGCRDITEEKTARIELELNQSRLEQAMEAGGIAWWEMDCQTGNVIFSPRKAEMLGYSPDQFSHYTDFTALLHPDDHEKAMQAMRDHLEGIAERYELEYRIQSSKGAYIWFRDVGAVTERNKEGAPLKVVGLVVNTTALKEADEALRESEERFKTLFMDSPVSIIIHDRDTGEIIDANWKACMSYGVSSLEELKGGYFWMEPPYSFEDALNYIRKAASEGPQEFEWLNRSKTGDLFWENVRLSSVVISGRERIIATSIDITARKVAEEELRKSEALLSTAGRISHFGGWSVDLARQRVIWSDEVARIHGMEPGYSPSVDEGISFYAPEWREKITEVFSACARDGTPFDEEMEIITEDGKRRWVRTLGEAVRDESGTITGVQGAFQDITRRKLAEEVQRKAYAQIEEDMVKFSALNDQIRNPLTVIMALADLEGGKYAQKIMEEVRAIDRIITLLDQGMLDSESTRRFMRQHDQL